ncbi:MAG: hypothetical protein A2406_00725 [Candidatus Komeilibacteria bacterium RIFOXYC1_FULL_37_11]|uniref:Uncharacterized protein n=1 Tax=Candidatus Komeilibacteria bacterium RIFOXYC1_FULL_37_11 TaxID=1798555 RepID=A0A1G2BWB0_9BACT|nr:MAG: hypothetical protein A2406_00725 [Candidatus Komeilibacteria bacterium RIFOXYC1_FULL_37_11]OGY95268.1 MAG: hypothetical protein A2611_01030 [Candidatus Komeilibacteria bacterium RIFOXYD1_FULL_37_29]
MTQNVVIQAIKILLIDLIGEILYFPLWWYTKGLTKMFAYVFESIRNTNRNLAVGLMFKNLFKPMFGQYDREGRIISFFFRILLTFSRAIIFVLLVILYLLVIIFWLFLPVAVCWGIFNNFSSLWKV